MIDFLLAVGQHHPSLATRLAAMLALGFAMFSVVVGGVICLNGLYHTFRR